MICEACEQSEGMPRDTKQFLCDSCNEGIDTYYCSSCDEVVHEDKVEYFGSQAMCPCGKKLEL